MCEHLKIDDEESYGTFNMGAGFAVYCAAGTGEDVVRIAKECGQQAWVSGVVENGNRQVILEPVNVTYSEDHLQLR